MRYWRILSLCFLKNFRLFYISDTDAYAVQVVFNERLNGVTLGIVSDAVSRDAVFLDEGLYYDVSTLLSQTGVDLCVTGLNVSVTYDVNLCLGILVQVFCDVLYLASLLGTDVSLVAEEEDVAAHGLDDNRLLNNHGLVDGIIDNHVAVDVVGLGAVALTQVDAQTSQGIEVPVGVASLL